jgi:hypothetical protein
VELKVPTKRKRHCLIAAKMLHQRMLFIAENKEIGTGILSKSSQNLSFRNGPQSLHQSQRKNKRAVASLKIKAVVMLLETTDPKRRSEKDRTRKGLVMNVKTHPKKFAWPF